MARGKYAAYLGHDDLWLPGHLDKLVRAAEMTAADGAYSLGIMIAPAGSPVRVLTGFNPSGEFGPDTPIPASTLLHRTEAAREVGGWPDFRTSHALPDYTLVNNLWAAGKRLAPVREITVLKFPSPWRKDVYRTRPCFEQQEYLRRIHDPDLLVSELTITALAYAEGNVRHPVAMPVPAPDAETGALIDIYREQRGLPRAAGDRAAVRLYTEPAGLRLFNRRRDIVPADGLNALYAGNRLPENGVFLGRGWHELESQDGVLFRWLDTNG